MWSYLGEINLRNHNFSGVDDSILIHPWRILVGVFLLQSFDFVQQIFVPGDILM